MATVYLMQDLRHDRPVVLKLMNSELAATVAPKRFLREIQLAARLDHPHILPVYDSGEDAGRLWYVMPYVETGSLRERLRRFPAGKQVSTDQGDINVDGDIVGAYYDGEFPCDPAGTATFGINDWGDIVRGYSDADGIAHGFLIPTAR